MVFPVYLRTLSFILGSILVVPADAGIYLNNNRIIFDYDKKKSGEIIQINSSSESDSPYLVKVQITQDIDGLNTQVPFVATPNLFRLDPGQSNQVRILSVNPMLPTDRESVFYFRAVALPVQKEGGDAAHHNIGGDLQLASGNVVKLFYRPQELTLQQDDAAKKLTVKASTSGVTVTNPTPYYLTLTSLKIDGKTVNLRSTPGSNMISPFSDSHFASAVRKGAAQWQIINDYGGMETFHGNIH